MPRLLRIVLIALAALCALYALASFWRQNERAAGLDFYIYFVAGQLAGRDDVANIYDAEVQARIGEEYFARAQQSSSELRKYDAGRRRRLDLVSSPFLYSTLRWVSRDYDRALTQYHVFLLACFAGGVLLLCRSVRLSWAASLFLLAALLLWYRGFEADLRVGNVNSIQLAVMAVFVWLSERARSSASATRAGLPWFVLGLLIAFKPNLLLVPLFFVVARLTRREQRRLAIELAYGAAGVATAVVVAAVTYGPRVWLQWVSAANAFYHRLPTRMERNVTPALSWFHQYGEWLSYVLAIALVLVVCVAIARSKKDDPPLLAGLGIAIYLLAANVVWLHYMVLVVPIAVALMRWRTTAVVALLALVLIAEEPFEILVRRAAFPIEPWLITPALVALFVAAVWTLSDRNPAPAR
jgi:hypothetical protein